MTEPPKSLDKLVRPHIYSFDYFIGEGLQTVVDLLRPIEVEHSCRWSAGTFVPAVACWADTCPGPLLHAKHPAKHASHQHSRQCICMLLQIDQPGTDRWHRLWFENPRVARPVKEDALGLADKRLLPRDCREAVCPPCP